MESWSGSSGQDLPQLAHLTLLVVLGGDRLVQVQGAAAHRRL
jgi:hypothetical protein